jgi:hypothetical protein
MKIINLPPFAPILMESTRAIGYSIHAAIADIIDNSITAKATKISVYFLPYDNPFIAILDNGIGMSSERLTESMRYGSNNSLDIRDENDLGRYGLGLKTASLSQCRCLTVITLYKDNLLARRWDLDYIKKTGRWDLIELESNEIIDLPMVDKLLKQKKGTLVIWSQLDKIKAGEITIEQALGNRMEEVMEHLSLVFHRYLSGDGVKKIAITINENEIKPFDPFFSTKSTVIMDDEKIDIPGRNEKVVVRPFILPHPSKMTKEELKKYGGKDGLRKLQGFYIYRNKRLLTWGTWFRVIKMDEFSKLARVRVDIPNSLDDLWALDIKKSTAYPPEVVKARLKQIIGTISNSSRKTWTFRKRKETDDNISHIWNRMNTRDGIRYFINQDHPLLEMVNERIDIASQKVLKEYIETIQNNLPLNTLHSDIHNETKIAQDDEKTEKKRVCLLAKALLGSAKNKDELERIYAGFEIVEPFNDYINEINEIYLEVKIDG